MLIVSTTVEATTYIFDPLGSQTGGTDGSGVWDTGTGNAAIDWFNTTPGLDPSDGTDDLGQWNAGHRRFRIGRPLPGTVSVANGVNVGSINFGTVSTGSYYLTGGSLNLGFRCTGSARRRNHCRGQHQCNHRLHVQRGLAQYLRPRHDLADGHRHDYLWLLFRS